MRKYDSADSNYCNNYLRARQFSVALVGRVEMRAAKPIISSKNRPRSRLIKLMRQIAPESFVLFFLTDARPRLRCSSKFSPFRYTEFA
jgi:hypothetical protein